MRFALVVLGLLSANVSADDEIEPLTVDAPWIVEAQPGWQRLFDIDETFSISPLAVYESGFGITGGAQIVHRDLFGDSEQLELRTAFGGRFDQAYGLGLRSGQRFSHVALALAASYERRPNEPYYGIGDDADLDMPFAENAFRTGVTADIPFTPELGDALKTRLSTTYLHRELRGDAFGSLRFEGALVVETRAWYVNLHAAISRDLASELYWFSSYGAELRKAFDLYRGEHVFALRAMFETIEVGTPRFIDLPQLGGTELLRGYPSGRFRDRALTLATAEYTWAFSKRLAAYTFVDAGRVWPSASDVTLDDARISYGLGLQVYTAKSHLGRVQAAASRDGDFVLGVLLSPRPR